MIYDLTNIEIDEYLKPNDNGNYNIIHIDIWVLRIHSTNLTSNESILSSKIMLKIIATEYIQNTFKKVQLTVGPKTLLNAL